MGLFDFLFGKKKQQSTDFKKLAQEGALILDVRTKKEYNAGHIKGAVNIPVQVIQNRLNEVKSKNKKVIAYCRSGRRSGNATTIMRNAGIDAYNGGGMEELKQKLT